MIGFAGNFMTLKVDFELLEAVAAARPEWTLLLIGPVQPDAEAALKSLQRHENVTWLGLKAYADLPRFVAAFDVGIIPYTRNAYTQSCQPVKLYEYLAAGKPIVASGLPALADKEPDVVLAEGADGFVAAIEDALRLDSDDDRARRMALAAQNTWENRASTLLDLVSQALEAH